MTVQKSITIGELREKIKDLPDDRSVVMTYFDYRNQEYVIKPIYEIYDNAKNQLVLGG